ncbi:MAG: VanW family protein [Acidobacteriaceae bacterium]
MLRSLLTVSLFLLLFPAISRGADLKFNDKTWPADVALNGMVKDLSIRNDLSLRQKSLAMLTGKNLEKSDYLISDKTIEQVEAIRLEIDKQPKSASLKIEDGKATEFEPGQLGQALDLYKLRRSLVAGKQQVDLPVLISYPQKALKDTNNLGINELISTGESDFTGSSGNRRTNIQVGSSKFNGVLVKPGEEFSFNSYLGEIDAAHGYKPEIVIKREGLKAEFGGGLCQVSTTAFRAAMNAGLNITQRRNHSFAVKYYAPQGTDATIYPGAQDLKFINDTKNYILIWTRMEGNKLFYDYYGTKDGRQVSFEGPTQYDRKASGAMKATWKKIVTLNGKTTEQVFDSTYVSPALFQKETTVQSSTPNPSAPTPTNPTENPQPLTPPAAPTPTT